MALAKATHKLKLDVVANPRKEKQITPKQEEFARIYCTEDISQTEAAIRAGYSVKSAHAIASQLLDGKRYPHVVERIREIKSELSRKYEVTFESHVKKAGLYIDRKEIMHGRIDQMSREEVMREISRLQQEFPALAAVAEGNMIIDVDPVEVEQTGE